MAWRICSRERRIGPNELPGKARASFGFAIGRLEDEGRLTSAGGGDGKAATGAAGISTKTGSGTTGGGRTSSGVVTSGGKGCAQLRLIFFGGGPPATGRGVIVRGRTSGGGGEPVGTPSASRKRLTLSSSLSGGARWIGLLGEGGLGFLASPEPWLSHLKITAIPARTRKMTVSFISKSDSEFVRRLPLAASQSRRWLRAWSCRPARFSFARNP